MAQIELNPDTGLFESVVGEESANEVVTPSDAADLLEQDAALSDQVYGELMEEDNDGALESEKDILDGVQSPAVEDSEGASALQEVLSDDDLIAPLAAVPSTASFTPTAWQVNLAESRPLGQHYLMYADRVYYGSGSNSYWHYFLILGDDIEYESDLYSYTDCDVYSYYSYSGTVYYDHDIGSGTVDGTAKLVYSDLYFDYVGADPAEHSSVYVLYALLMVIIVLLIVGRKTHV